MNPEEQRIAIAKACGWEVREIIYNNGTAKSWVSKGKEPIPDYLEDLNAMHEAVKQLPIKSNFAYHLRRVMGMPEYPTEEQVTHWSTMAINATAAQRAEAFLKTLNLWEDAR